MSAAVVALGLIASMAFTWLAGTLAISVTRRWHGGHTGVGIAIAVVAAGAISLVAVVGTFVARPVAPYGMAALWLAIFAVVLRRKSWQGSREFTLVMVLATGAGLLSVGLLYLWGSDLVLWELAQQRFTPSRLPSDNAVPALFAQAIAEGSSTQGLLGDWNGSDRPPLMSGFILATAGPGVVLGQAREAAFASSVGAQLLWVPGTWALLRCIGLGPRLVAPPVVFAIGTYTMVVNTAFTWPKLMAAALVLSALAILVSPPARAEEHRWLPPLFCTAVASATLAAVAHGGSIFLVPALVVAGLVAIPSLRRPTILARRALGAACVGFAFYLPWLLYQRLVDPPGDRLLKWHLAGETDLSKDSALDVVVGAYRDAGLSEVLHNKWTNLVTAFWFEPLRGIVPAGAPFPHGRTNAEFLVGGNALSLAVPVGLGLIAWVGVSKWRRLPLDHRLRPLASLAALGVMSMVVWALALFGPGSTVVHHGSHAWIIIGLVAPVAGVALASERIAWCIVVMQCAFSAALLVPGTPGFAVHPLGLASLVLGVATIAVSVGSLRTIGEAPSTELGTPPITQDVAET